MPMVIVDQSQWLKVQTIGVGAQASATLMQHMVTGRLAVRKKMKTYQVIDDGTPLECLILQEILPRSGNIIRLLGSTLEGQFDDLVHWFEHCPGGDLQHAMDGLGTVPEDFIWHCLIQIAHALDVLHNRGSQRVVHTDIKPDNIFLEAKYRRRAPWPNLKIGDFGSAVLGEGARGIHVPCWQGPEVPSLTSAGDIWSLGAIIHWLGTGKPPILPRPHTYPGSTKDWQSLPESRQPRTLPRFYSRELNDRMLACLEWDPRDRPTTRSLIECLERDRSGSALG